MDQNQIMRYILVRTTKNSHIHIRSSASKSPDDGRAAQKYNDNKNRKSRMKFSD